MKHRGRTFLCLALTMAQSMFYNAVFFPSTLILLRFYGASAAHAGLLFLPIPIANFTGPIFLSHLLDSVGRRIVTASNFVVPGVVFAISTLLFSGGHLSTTGQVAWWAVSFFFASTAAGSTYLTTSELFPQQIRASTIAIFHAVGTLLGGVLDPIIFGVLLPRRDERSIVFGF